MLLAIYKFMLDLAKPTKCWACYWSRILVAFSVGCLLTTQSTKLGIIMASCAVAWASYKSIRKIYLERAIMAEMKEMYSNHGIGTDKPIRVNKDGVEHEVTFSVDNNKAKIHVKDMSSGKVSVENVEADAGNQSWMQKEVMKRFKG